MRGFLLPVFVALKVPGSTVVRAGLALVSRVYPWFFHGGTVCYDSEGTRSIDRDRRCRLSSHDQCSFLGRLASTLLPGDFGLQKRRQWEEEMAEVREVQPNLSIARTRLLYSKVFPS